MNWSYPLMRSEDPDPCPTSLFMSYEMKTPGRRCLPEGCSGSHVNAPQKPNCRSPVQGLERQRLRRQLPSRSSLCVELWDGNTHTSAGLWVCLVWLLALAFAPLKAKSQPKDWIQEVAFSKSRLSCIANLKAPLYLFLVAFRMELWKHILKNF
jgi:hypothetical protein